MIVELEKFNSLKRWSRERVMVRCDHCGRERHVQKESITMRPSIAQRCQRCAAAAVCRSFTGTKRSEQHRILTGLASRGRRWTRRQETVKRGAESHSWNPDRQLIETKERARKEAYRLLHHALRRIGTIKSASTEDMLGYTPMELHAHLTRYLADGMSWSDRRAWHIDHVKPVSAFVAEGVTDIRVINALDNLRPVWSFENLSKGSNWTVVGK